MKLKSVMRSDYAAGQRLTDCELIRLKGVEGLFVSGKNENGRRWFIPASACAFQVDVGDDEELRAFDIDTVAYVSLVPKRPSKRGGKAKKA